MLDLVLLIVVAVACQRVWVFGRRADALTRRVSELEQTIIGLSATRNLPDAPAPGAEPQAAAPEQPPEARADAEAPPEITEPQPKPAAPQPPVPEPIAARQAAPAASRRFGSGLELDGLIGSIRERWLIWVAAASLAMGAVFLVQYGIEKGFLGPVARVAGAALLGVCLIAAAERLRERAHAVAGVLDPAAAFAAGGISALFTAAFAAHFLYGLTGPTIGFFTMAAASVAAILYGVRHGPVLSVIGVLGAYLTPLFIDSSEGSTLLYAYALLVAVAALLIERYRSWAWLSALATVLALMWGGVIFLNTGPDFWFACFTLALLAAVVVIPEFGLPPASDEHAMTAEMLLARQPFFYPTVLATLTCVAGMAALALSAPVAIISGQAALLAGAALTAAMVWALRRAEGLDDGAILTALGFLAVLAMTGWASYADLAGDQHLGRGSEITPGDLRLLGLAGAMSALAGVAVFAGALTRAMRGSRPALWSAVAAIYPPAVLVVFYLVWGERTGFSDALWGVIAALVAVPPVLAAGRFRAHARAMDLPAGLLALGAIGLIGLAAGFALTGAPLTIAFAVIALAAVMLDRRFDMALLGGAAQAAALLATARLVIEPGLPFAIKTDLTTLWLAFAPTILLLAAGAHAARSRARTVTRAVLESAALSLAALFLSILFARWLDDGGTILVLAGLLTLTWGIAALTQAWRARAGGPLARLRRVLGWAYAAIAGLTMLIALSFGNPLFDATFGIGGSVTGPPVLDSMALAYLLPGLLLLAAPRISGVVPGWRQRLAWAGGGGLAALWIGLEIRRFWRGDDLSVPGVTNAELYSYTVAMLLATMAAIVAGHLTHSRTLRTAGTALAMATAFKVFAVDMAGLVGLARAASFIGLGLALAAIGWLHGRLLAPQPTG